MWASVSQEEANRTLKELEEFVEDKKLGDSKLPMYDIPDTFENAPPKLRERHQQTPKKYQEPEKEKVPGGG